MMIFLNNILSNPLSAGFIIIILMYIILKISGAWKIIIEVIKED